MAATANLSPDRRPKGHLTTCGDARAPNHLVPGNEVKMDRAITATRTLHYTTPDLSVVIAPNVNDPRFWPLREVSDITHAK